MADKNEWTVVRTGGVGMPRVRTGDVTPGCVAGRNKKGDRSKRYDPQYLLLNRFCQLRFLRRLIRTMDEASNSGNSGSKR